MKTILPQIGSRVWLGIGSKGYEAKLVEVGEEWAFQLLDGTPIKASQIDSFAYVPGGIVGIDEESLYVATNDGFVSINEIQSAGKKKMTVKEWLRGNQVKVGDYFAKE